MRICSKMFENEMEAIEEKRISKLMKMEKEDLILLIKEMQLDIMEKKKKIIKIDFKDTSTEFENQILKEELENCQRELLNMEKKEIERTAKKIRNDFIKEKIDFEMKKMESLTNNAKNEEYEILVSKVFEMRKKGISFSEIRISLDITNNQARNMYAVAKEREKAKNNI